MQKRLTALLCFAALLAMLYAGGAQAAPGVAEDSIHLGQSCALSGPAEDLGKGMRAGLLAAFGKINDAGGVQGRSIELTSLDDGYEPDKAIPNTRKLIDEEQVFALIGEVGTPTSKAVVPIAEENKVPFFGPFTGAEFLRNPFKKYVVNIRASYNQEMERLAKYLVDEKGMKNIACFYQNDSYGRAGLSGIEKALADRGMELAATGTYERNTVAVKGGLLDIRKAKPEAVVMVGAYKPCAEFIKVAKKVGMDDVTFCNISFVGSKSLAKALGDAGDGVIISQVVVYPWDESIPLVKEYTAAMKQYQPDHETGFISLEGYMVGKTFGIIAEAAGKDLTRETFLAAIPELGTIDLGGVSLEYGPEDHQGMDEVFLTVIQGGEIKPLE